MFDEKLHNWFFHFNPYTGMWNGIHREYLVHYLTDPSKIPDTHKVESRSRDNITTRALAKNTQQEPLNHAT